MGKVIVHRLYMTILDFGVPCFWTIHMGLGLKTGEKCPRVLAMENMISDDHRIHLGRLSRRTCQFLGDSDEEEGSDRAMNEVR